MIRVLVSALHDPTGAIAKISDSITDVLSYCNLIVSVSAASSPDTFAFLRSHNIPTVPGDSWGTARINLLRSALQTAFDYVYYLDFDKLPHWIKVAPQELKSYLTSDLSPVTFGGRTATAWATYPTSWVDTEQFANRLYSQHFNIPDLDFMAAQITLDYSSAQVVASQAKEVSWASCGEWPLICFQNNLSMSSKFFDGLSWEDPDRLALPRSEIDQLYDSELEWSKRRANAEAIISLL